MSSFESDLHSSYTSLKAYLTNTPLPDITIFLKKLINNTQPNPILRQFHDLPTETKETVKDIVKFTNTLLEYTTENNEKNIQLLNKAIGKMGMTLAYEQNDLCVLLNDVYNSFKKNKIYSQFISLDWQISVIDRKNDNVNLSKAEKIEVVTKINAYDAYDQNYHSHLVKMNYNEFQEILTNFKKIDAQLHLFKE